jgi:hypothetical protein
MPHIHDAQPAAARTKQNIIQVIADEREDVLDAILLDRIDKEFGPGRHALAIIAGRNQGRASILFVLGTPFVWQSEHFTQCTLCLLSGDRKVVSIFSTSMPQLDIFG